MDKKILIAGNPSSETPFVVGLLTRLGLDTGYTEKGVEGNYNGLEIMSGSKDKRRYRRKNRVFKVNKHLPHDRVRPLPT